MNFSDFIYVKRTEGLVPAIVQDYETMQIVAIGYMNQEAFRKTQETGLVTFFSRSRGKIHTHGEHSGNYMRVKKMTMDNRKEHLLIMAKLDAPFDSSKHMSAFPTDQHIGYYRHLEQKIRQRHQHMAEGSYTSHLFDKGREYIVKKLMEKTTQLIIQAIKNDKQAFVENASEQSYLSLVLMEDMGTSLAEIENNMAERYETKNTGR